MAGLCCTGVPPPSECATDISPTENLRLVACQDPSDEPAEGSSRPVTGGCLLEVLPCMRNDAKCIEAHKSSWGTVCDDGFGDVNARVVCKELGFDAGVAIPRFGSHGFMPVWMVCLV